MKIIRATLQQDSLERAVGDLHIVRARKMEIEREFEEAQQVVVTLMQASGVKSSHVGKVTATLVQRSRPKYKEDSLAKALGAKMWEKVTKRVLDTKKLEAAVADGDVDINIVAACTEITNDRPFVRMSEKSNEGAEVL